jgi:predicted dehydrogenase/nucleoside-diphosphate-sugar epimerase
MTQPIKTGSLQRVALLGSGYIADWHARCLASVKDVELVAVCDRVLPRAQALASKYGVAGVYGSLEAMLVAEKLDAVHILLPPDLHFDAARTILAAGVNIFLEKPMCERAEECDLLVALAAERGLRLGVGHNFLFAATYEKLRRDLQSGVLGKIDQVNIAWNRVLPQATHGPFDIWMLRDAKNILIEIGSHLISQMLDLVGEPDEMAVHPSNGIVLPTGRSFYRRWQVNAYKDKTAVELRFSFVPGFAEYTLHVRGSLASATVDFERNTYTLEEHHPCDPDFENFAMVRHQARSLRHQAIRTLARYILSKLKLCSRGNPYGESIARAMDAFYATAALDERLDGCTGARVIRLCQQMGSFANLPSEPIPVVAAARPTGSPPRILVLGGTGFIGRELVRQLVAAGHRVRLLARSAANLPVDLRVAEVECQTGDLMNVRDLASAMEGIEYVFHLARANVKSWADYQHYEIEATEKVAECALTAGVKRFIYTGTIDSYYAGRSAGRITEATRLDPQIARRNLYARAKAASEEILNRMHREQGLPLVILRPGIVIGRGGSPFHWGVGMWWSDSVCQIWGRGNNKLPLVLVEDVATALIAAMNKSGIEGRSFNLAADPCLTAQEYLEELDRAGGIHIQHHATPILHFYMLDMLKWVVKVAVLHPEHRLPMYRDWETRSSGALFDCTAAKTVLGWQPVSVREELVRRGIAEPFQEVSR